jgi:hypothetical protein
VYHIMQPTMAPYIHASWPHIKCIKRDVTLELCRIQRKIIRASIFKLAKTKLGKAPALNLGSVWASEMRAKDFKFSSLDDAGPQHHLYPVLITREEHCIDGLITFSSI